MKKKIRKPVIAKVEDRLGSSGMILPCSNSLGDITVTERSLCSIIRKCVSRVPGVAKLTGNNLVENLAELVGSRRMKDRSIQLTVHEGLLSVELALIIIYGSNLPQVAALVQKAVSEVVYDLTGITVEKVNIVVRELETALPDDGEDEDEEE